MVDIDWFVKLAKVNINIDFNIDSSVTQIYIEEKLLYCNWILKRSDKES